LTSRLDAISTHEPQHTQRKVELIQIVSEEILRVRRTFAPQHSLNTLELQKEVVMFHIRHARVFSATFAVLLASGCAMQAPRYQASIDNVEVLKQAPNSMNLGGFSVQAGSPAAASGGTALSVRASPMNSPVGTDYAAYLADALSQELTVAKKLDPKSKIEVSGKLVKNDISAGGFSTNSGEIAAQFVVKKEGVVRFDKAKSASLTWDSSFLGAVAIPKAQQQYPVIVQKLLSLLWGDADFQAALK
jgi:hypothetical protein